MAGLFILSRINDRTWSAATWMFDWVLSFLADNIDDEVTVHDLHLICEANLGSVDLDEFNLPARRAILALLRTQLVPAATQWLTEPHKAAALTLIQELENLARATPD